jgi:hypothetical protein
MFKILLFQRDWSWLWNKVLFSGICCCKAVGESNKRKRRRKIYAQGAYESLETLAVSC